MAIQIKSYWKTTDMTADQLQQAISSCNGQDYKLLHLFKTYGKLTSDDAYVLYNELIGPIKESSIGRSINTIKKNKVIYPIGNIDGPYGRPVTLYTIVDNPPTELQTFNKSLPKSITVEIVYQEDGKVDVEQMFELTAKEIDFIINKYDL